MFSLRIFVNIYHGNSAFSLLRGPAWTLKEHCHPNGSSAGYQKWLGYKTFWAPRDIHWAVISITFEAIHSLDCVAHDFSCQIYSIKTL